MCRIPEHGVMRVETTEKFIKRVFYKASIVEKSSIISIQFSPTETWHRKLSIDNILKDTREKEGSLNTLVRPGEEDWELGQKKCSKY